ncbi:ferredoxin-type protein NapF [Pasteurellaceae bacterium LIM206]|nr:ferredoxin-type protein NapF [Pasteurellaceae bacterium LIM206]
MSRLTEQSLPRRQFLRGQFFSALQTEKVALQGFQGIRPPWAASEEKFVEGCIRCGDCIAVCESRILIKGAGGYPEVSFANGECTFCGKCVQVCEQPIFRTMTEPAWRHKVEIKSDCLSFHGVECRSCEDSCESRAIYFKRGPGGIAKPYLNLVDCNGCGACLAVCPSQSINVKTAIEHE